MTRRPLARTTVLALVVLAALAGAACSGDDRSGPTTAPASSTPPPTSTVEVGALLDLSGPGATLGTATEQALRAAVTTAAGDGVRVELDVRDTGGDPAAAERELTALHDEAGLHVVIGPQTSAEAAQVLPYANANDILLVSPASTASTLAVDGDALYRMVPTDRVEGAATADLMTAEGPVTVVTASRDDPGNTGLAQAVGDAVVARGGSVVTGPVYPADASAPTAAPDAVARQIADAVADAAGEVEPVVYLAGFGEVAGILAAAADLTELQDTRFFGGDGSARSAAVTEDAAAAAFAAGDAAGFPSPLPALGDDAAEPPAALADAVPNADPLALGAFDALLIVVKALGAAGPDAEGPALRSAFATAASGYPGVSGVVQLDDAGDRSSMAFAYWSVCATSGSDDWTATGTWTPPAEPSDPGTVSWTGCTSGG